MTVTAQWLARGNAVNASPLIQDQRQRHGLVGCATHSP
jgi:hypothetical protein